jgi:hypothetical protein
VFVLSESRHGRLLVKRQDSLALLRSKGGAAHVPKLDGALFARNRDWSRLALG